MSEPLWAIAAVALLGVTFWFAHAPAPSIAGDVAVDTSTHFHLWRGANDADGTYQVRDGADQLVSAFHVRYNRVSEVPLDRPTDATPYHSHYDRDYYAAEPAFDIGVWTGYARFGGDNRHWQSGVRCSPLRLLYGTIGTDLALSQDAAGAGISLYPPPDYFGAPWEHFGLGAWYMAPFDGGSPSWVYGLSFSAH